MTFLVHSTYLFLIQGSKIPGSHVGPQNRIGHLACHHMQLMQVPVLSASGIQTGYMLIYIYVFFSPTCFLLDKH